jgi:hypothetical protein
MPGTAWLCQTMFKPIKPFLADLFGAEASSGLPVRFAWLLVQRKHRPFLLIPLNLKNLGRHVGLELYSAHRRRAKIWRAALPFVLRTPVALVFERLHWHVNDTSELIRFLSQQAGVSVESLATPAVKFGGRGNDKPRFVLLVCDQTNRPVKVIKVGIDTLGRAATQREADLLERLPPDTIGCIRLTGRLTTPQLSAFATAYFPGESPDNDAGMETLFHSWINAGPPVPIESLDAWHDLETVVAAGNPVAWQTLRPFLAGNKIRTTLHHGDFAPWNIRAVNSQNLQAFDWEGGSLKGVPGWDWFHFIIQTSILAKRHSVERVSAEVEQLLESPRFKKYADEAGISLLVKPLMLAYLLRHNWVVRPLEGARETTDLYNLLAAHWGFTPRHRLAIAGLSSQDRMPAAGPAVPPARQADASQQLKSAWAQLANIFWEPTLNARLNPGFHAPFKICLVTALFCLFWLAGLACVQFFYNNHLMLLPLYCIPSLLFTWNLNRRWGTVVACLAALVSPLIMSVKEPAIFHLPLVCWNSVMRFLTMQICVFLADRLHQQKNFFRSLATSNYQPADFARQWAVVLLAGLWFCATAVGDFYTGPHVIFLPLYLFPAMLVTLFLNLRWGAFMVFVAAILGCVEEYIAKVNPHLWEVFGWNFFMRFSILFLAIFLLDRLSHQSVLFIATRPNGAAKLPNRQ